MSSKEEFGVGALPQQEVAQPLLAAGADEEVHVRRARAVHRLSEGVGEIGASQRATAETRGSPAEGVAGGVVHGDAEMQPLAAPRLPLRPRDRRAHRLGQPVAPADHAQPHVVLLEPGDLGREEAAEQPHQRRHFGGRPLPVVRRERVERERADPEPRRGFDDAADGLDADAVALGAGPPPGLRPAAVAVHDEGDVEFVLRFHKLLCVIKYKDQRKAGSRVPPASVYCRAVWMMASI